jgi:hypothetical protein
MNSIFYVVTDKNGRFTRWDLTTPDPIQTTDKLTRAMLFEQESDAQNWVASNDGGDMGLRVREVYARVE